MGHGPGTSKSVQTSEVPKCAANEGVGMDYKPVCFLSRFLDEDQRGDEQTGSLVTQVLTEC